MDKRIYWFLVVLMLAAPVWAEEEQQLAPAVAASQEEGVKIVSGFSGGMMLHVGYAFSSSPDALFRNSTISDVQNLPKDGMTMGIGGAIRLHLLKHLRIGSEGFVSNMPLMKSGSSIRTAWGGALIDCYWKGNKVTPFIGGTIGGGSTKRLYVPGNGDAVTSATDSVSYNSSYTKTPFFFLDPYFGLEFELTKRLNIITRIDWMLPFGKGERGIRSADDVAETVSWSNFLSPSGPRLYIGFMFKH